MLRPYGSFRRATLLGSLLTVVALSGAYANNEQVLYAFTGGPDGADPINGVTRDAAGNLYGTTFYGGTGGGAVFKLSPDGTLTTLHTFTGGADGKNPSSNLILDKASGVLYGAAEGGPNNYGLIFALAPDGTETVIYNFTGGGNGNNPVGPISRDAQGNFYGTSNGGGDCNCGIVYKVTSSGIETVLHTFTGSDGANPTGLKRFHSGYLYGTTFSGGGGCGCGTVFKIAPDGTETVLHAFAGGGDGSYPQTGAGVVKDRSGNLYGTTYTGGASNEGTVYKIAPDGTETVLHSFTGGSDGDYPISDLLITRAGRLYGTTSSGGDSNKGTVFALDPDGTESILHSFSGGSDGAFPRGRLTHGRNGLLYGTTYQGGPSYGTVFSVNMQ